MTEPIKIWRSAHALAILQGLILISAANVAPVLFARKISLDGGAQWRVMPSAPKQMQLRALSGTQSNPIYSVG